MVDRDLEAIVKFCKNFNSNLSEIEGKAQELNTLGSNINTSLANTKFATNASSAVETTAKKVITAVQQGSQRIREIQRRAEEQIAERDSLERF